MKKTHIYTLFGALMMIIVLPACKKGYFDLNDNPNLVQEPPINAMLSTVTHKTGVNSQSFANFISYYTQYLASPSAGSTLDTYDYTDQSSRWNLAYYTLADLYDMQQKAIELESSEHLGVANVLMAYNLGLIADVWGSAPYSDALKGDKLLVAYDSEEALYQASIDLLETGIQELEKTDSKVTLGTNEDVIHQGNKEAWLKTAYAIYARFLNKISKKSSYDPSAVLAAIDQSYASSADNAVMGVFDGINQWAEISQDNKGALLGGWLSSNWIDHLNGETYGVFDPRIEKITEKTVNDDYVGTRNGQGNVGGPNTVFDECYISEFSPWTSEDSPYIIVSYAELKFIEAEAALRLPSPDRTRAYAAYQEGIRASMDMLEVPAADRDAYMNNPAVQVGASNLNLDLIFKEKYVVTYLNTEAWNDMRRHDYQYEGLQLPMNAHLSTFIRRVPYPQNERAENGANVPEDLSLDTPLWWDQP